MVTSSQGHKSPEYLVNTISSEQVMRLYVCNAFPVKAVSYTHLTLPTILRV